MPWQQLVWLDDVSDTDAQADARVAGNRARLESGRLNVEELAEALVKGDFPTMRHVVVVGTPRNNLWGNLLMITGRASYGASPRALACNAGRCCGVRSYGAGAAREKRGVRTLRMHVL